MKLLLFIIPFALFSCKNHKIIEAKPEPISTKQTPCEKGLNAIIKPLSLDGCTWILELSSGEKLEPVNYRDFLTEEEIINQQPVKVIIVFNDTKSASICMVGRTVSISCLERLE